MKARERSRPLVPYVIAAMAGLACLAIGDQIQLPHVFSAGTRAMASEINDNFRAIAGVVNGHLDGSNLEASSITSRELAPASVGATHIATGSVGNSQLATSFAIGRSGVGGFTTWRNPSGSDKVLISTNTQGGGYVEIRQESDSQPALILSTPVSGDGGQLDLMTGSGSVALQLQSDGDIFKTGNVGFVHPHPEDPAQQIMFVSLEGGERGTYFRGSTSLVNGRVEIVPPESWRLVSSSAGLTVQVTPRGPSRGVYVAEASRERILVLENDGGTSDAELDYLVLGLREGYESHAVFAPNTMFLPTRERWAGDPDAGNARALVRNGILSPNGMVNHALVQSIRALAHGAPDEVGARASERGD